MNNIPQIYYSQNQFNNNIKENQNNNIYNNNNIHTDKELFEECVILCKE